MTESNQDKTYTSKTKTFVLQQPISWGNIKDVLAEKFDVEETEGKIILENKNNKDFNYKVKYKDALNALP